MNFNEIVTQQKEFFLTQKTKDLRFRKMMLKKMKEVIIKNEEDVYEAIEKDFGKSRFDTFTTEISFVLKDIDYYVKNLSKFATPKRVPTNLVNQIATSKIFYEPLGNALIIGAWNYPFQLSLSPVVAAIAAGNTVILKPSEVAENSMKLMAKIINTEFSAEFLHVVEGGVDETTELLKQKFDTIFFTGSTRVGKIVYEAAAKNLTPVTLELGGKSPAIVTCSANFEVAAKRIVWGKFLNAGQTCVAPDYIVVDEKVKDKFLEYLRKYIREFNYQPESQQYTRIINPKNFARITSLINSEKVYCGGDFNREKLYIEPTVMHEVNWDEAVMQEEIFGPILPVLSYAYFREALLEIQKREKPLAAYLFTSDQEEMDLFNSQISFGGGCINDVIMHLSNDHLPFGGVGNSGMGNYHGKFGFKTFSHEKAVMKRATWGEPNIKYPPYSENKLKWIKKFL